MSVIGHRIVAPVSIVDVQTLCPVRLVSGSTVINSTDVGVLCSARDGDTVRINGTTYTVRRANNINPWARYRPFPGTTYNKQGLLTPAERAIEVYGIESPVDMFTADDIQAYEDYANQIENYGADYLQLRPWGDTKYRRLADFVKTDANGAIVSGVGYDHEAKPDAKQVTISSGKARGTYYLQPVIPESQHTIVIPPGSTQARYELPNDHRWLDIYYQYVYGSTTEVVSVSGNEEWLSPIDLMGGSTYQTSYASVRRRVLIFRWDEDDAKWRFYNYVTDKVGGSLATRPFSSYPQAWLDLTDTASAANTYYYNNPTYHPMSTLTGKCLFIDCWVESNSSVNVRPIPGFAYTIEINRANIDISIDVTGVLTFMHVEVTEDSSGSSIYYIPVLFIDYNPSALNLPAGLEDAGATVVPVLQQYFDLLSMTLQGVTVNLLNTSLEYATDTGGEGSWFRISVVLPRRQSVITDTTSIINGTRRNTGIGNTKAISVSY